MGGKGGYALFDQRGAIKNLALAGIGFIRGPLVIKWLHDIIKSGFGIFEIICHAIRLTG
jgi:hypothetical protein